MAEDMNGTTATSAPKYQPKRYSFTELNPNERVMQFLVWATVYLAIPAIGIIGMLVVGHALHAR